MVWKLLLRSLVAERHRHAESGAHMRPQVPGVPGLTRYLDPGLQQRAVSTICGGPAAGQGSSCGGPVQGLVGGPSVLRQQEACPRGTDGA